MNLTGMDGLAAELAARLASGGRLADADIDRLAASHDILAVGMLADDVRRAKHGRRTTFVRVATFDVNQPVPDPASIAPAAGEWRIVGTPADLASALRTARGLADLPNRRPLSGLSLADVERLAGAAGRTLNEALLALHDAGLESIAYLPADRVADLDAALDAVQQAGMRVGRISFERSSPAERLALLRRIAATAGAGAVRAVAPLPMTVTALAPTTGYDDVKIVALARLVVDNVPSVQVDWTLYGPKLAQVALTFGADDLDSVSPLDEVPEGRRRAPLEEVRRNIAAAGFDPVERDGRYAARG